MRLFTIQIILGCILLLFSIVGIMAQQREVAITFDDLPATFGDYSQYKYITEKLLAKLKNEKVPTIGFVNARKLYVGKSLDIKRVALLKQWRGKRLANAQTSAENIRLFSFN